MIYFTHIPHTGGRSICTALTQAFPDHQCIHHTLEILPGKGFVYGHTHPLPPRIGLFQFTLLRHPVTRVLSHWCYVRDAMEGPPGVIKSGYQNAGVRWPLNLEQFVDQAPFENIENGMVKQLAGLPCVNEPGNTQVRNRELKEAKRALQQMQFIGNTEDFTADVGVLFRRLGVAAPIPWEGRSENKPELSQGLYDFIIERNKYDVMLYNYYLQSLT